MTVRVIPPDLSVGMGCTRSRKHNRSKGKERKSNVSARRRHIDKGSVWGDSQPIQELQVETGGF